jgi:DNA polymerase-1
MDKVQASLSTILHKLNTNNYACVFSPSKTFRHEICPTYKANRKDKRKPLGLKDLINDVFKYHNGMRHNNIEADDLIGILCTKNDSYVAVSGDKDFATLPCKWYNFLKDEYSERTVEEANYNHLIQTLTGDTVDGYAGVKGIGPKTAEKLLRSKGASWSTVVDIYESKGMTKEEALLNARLAYILRADDYDVKTQTIKALWTPNQ